jgi:hypothetical protein
MSGIEILALGALVVACGTIAWAVARTWLWLRGPRVVVCPETGQPAGVALDVRYGLASAAVSGADLRLRQCSRWPEKQHCGQECLAQIEEAPEGCRVRSLLGRWYEGRSCAVCGQAFAPIAWHDHKPAIRWPDGITVEWVDLRPEAVPEELAAGEPVCWNCHVALRFRRERPDLVIERPPLPPLR